MKKALQEEGIIGRGIVPKIIKTVIMVMVSTGVIAPDKMGYLHNIFSYFSTKTYIVGTH